MAYLGTRGSKKGKAPAKRKAPEPSPPRVEDSSDEEEELMPDFEAMIRKLSSLERDRMLAKSQAGQMSPGARRAARAQRIAERDKLGEELRAKILEMQSNRSTDEAPVTPSGSGQEAGPSATPRDLGASGRRVPAGAPLDLSSLAPPVPAPAASVPVPLPANVRPWPPSGNMDGAIQAAGTPGASSSRHPAAGDGEAPRPKQVVCLVGHSFIYWAGKFAGQSKWGTHLGFHPHMHLEWRGWRGLKWAGLVRVLNWENMEVTPDAIVFHLGGNDLTIRKGKDLIEHILRDLRCLKEFFPGTRLLWSNIVPRRSWRASCHPRVIDRSRRGVNREVSRAMRSGLGSVIDHPHLRAERVELYRDDGVHLSPCGLDLFLEDIQRGLWAEFFGDGGGQGGK